MEVFDPRVLPICRQILLHKKQSLLNGLFDEVDIEPQQGTSAAPEQLSFEHMADPQEALNSRRRQLLYEIEHALAKIQNGVYGYCERTRQPIDRFRLLATPWARYGTDVQQIILPEEPVSLDLTSLESI